VMPLGKWETSGRPKFGHMATAMPNISFLSLSLPPGAGLEHDSNCSEGLPESVHAFFSNILMVFHACMMGIFYLALC
jgi:hypothetical protein